MQILIVDDDRATVDVIHYTINWKKIDIEQVYEAYNITQAKEILENTPVDIVISDIEMPQGSGLELLSWFRDRQMEGEFLLLTCHEKFSYATDAVKLHAAEYILKPFDAGVMEAALKKLVLKIKEDRQIRMESRYGHWMVKNQRKLQLSFLEKLFLGEWQNASLETEALNWHLDLSPDELYILVVTKITEAERDRANVSPELLRFIIENIHSEVLCGDPVNHTVIVWPYQDSYLVVTVCRSGQPRNVLENCERLIREYHRIYTAAMTCCVCNPCKMAAFSQTFRSAESMLNTAVIYYGKCFLANQWTPNEQAADELPDYQTLERYIRERKKMELLTLLKNWMTESAACGKMNRPLLQRLEQEILQVVYTWLGKQRMPVQGLAEDASLSAAKKQAAQSMTGMIRWVNLLTEKLFAYEDTIKNSYSLTEKINRYIRDNYMKNIGRNDIAAEFFLAPEYVSKLYKKETGKGLNDAINEYRIEQAKLLLRNGDIRVSDVSDAVGFENYTYFSTIFKKYTGISPRQFKKEEEADSR